jgi:hypothetical protein
MFNNYFVSILGETLQRMTIENARYSIALPNHPKFRRLWHELPEVARDRTRIEALFVDVCGNIRIAS